VVAVLQFSMAIMFAESRVHCGRHKKYSDTMYVHLIVKIISLNELLFVYNFMFLDSNLMNMETRFCGKEKHFSDKAYSTANIWLILCRYFFVGCGKHMGYVDSFLVACSKLVSSWVTFQP
jgi:hypothetical protein